MSHAELILSSHATGSGSGLASSVLGRAALRQSSDAAGPKLPLLSSADWAL